MQVEAGHHLARKYLALNFGGLRFRE
jgi:hypothetical protein